MTTTLNTPIKKVYVLKGKEIEAYTLDEAKEILAKQEGTKTFIMLKQEAFNKIEEFKRWLLTDEELKKGNLVYKEFSDYTFEVKEREFNLIDPETSINSKNMRIRYLYHYDYSKEKWEISSSDLSLQTDETQKRLTVKFSTYLPFSEERDKKMEEVEDILKENWNSKYIIDCDSKEEYKKWLLTADKKIQKFKEMILKVAEQNALLKEKYLKQNNELLKKDLKEYKEKADRIIEEYNKHFTN